MQHCWYMCQTCNNPSARHHVNSSLLYPSTDRRTMAAGVGFHLLHPGFCTGYDPMCTGSNTASIQGSVRDTIPCAQVPKRLHPGFCTGYDPMCTGLVRELERHDAPSSHRSFARNAGDHLAIGSETEGDGNARSHAQHPVTTSAILT